MKNRDLIMSMKKQLTEINSKLKTLHLELKQTEGVIQKLDNEAVERHRNTILNLTRLVQDHRNSIEEANFSAGDSEETVTTWSQEIAQELLLADKSCAELSKCIKVIDDEIKVNLQLFVKITLNGSIAFIFSVKICLAVKRNANNKFKCGRMGHGDEVLRFYKNCAI